MKKIIPFLLLILAGCSSQPKEVTLKETVQDMVARTGFQQLLKESYKDPLARREFTFLGTKGQIALVTRYSATITYPDGVYYRAVFSHKGICAVGNPLDTSVEHNKKACILAFSEFQLKE